MKQTPDSSKLLELVKTTLDDDKAQDIVVIDLAGKTTLADFMVVACGRSARQVAALAGKMQEKLKNTGYGKVPVEGLPQSDWVLVDAGDVIIHLFRPEVREFYNLEKMWGELAPSEDQLGEESLAADEDDWAAV
jgi:ribosome-associated protein